MYAAARPSSAVRLGEMRGTESRSGATNASQGALLEPPRPSALELPLARIRPTSRDRPACKVGVPSDTQAPACPVVRSIAIERPSSS